MFVATDAKARAPSCFRIGELGVMVKLRYLRMIKSTIYGLPLVTSEFPYFVSSHGFCVQPKADKMISFSDALVVSWNCLNAKFHS